MLFVPINIGVDLHFDLLKLKGDLIVMLFNFKIFSPKLKVKKGYIYIISSKKTKKEQLSLTNPNLKFLKKYFQMTYFRQKIILLNLEGEIGYLNNAFSTAMLASSNDIAFKSLFAPIKNNKKTAHIFVEFLPNYSKDIYTMQLKNISNMSLFDLFYAFVIAKLRLKGM